ncbi:MAG: clan AA aspartic protease [Limnothrix sp.]
MMHGLVNINGDPVLRLVLENDAQQTHIIDAVIDTGYTGFLSLPTRLIEILHLPWIGNGQVTLGDGRAAVFEMYSVRVIWDGHYRQVPVSKVDTEPLIGLGLLAGYALQMEVTQHGIVTIDALR